ncbi:MAG TPA: hypothetical protein VF219_04075 [Vicinamibacterales bacterium]
MRTDAVSVLFTTEPETLIAARVAAPLAAAMSVPLTVIHFRTVPYPLSVDAPVGLSPVEGEAFKQRLQEEDIDARVRVYLCRSLKNVLPMAFRGHSLIAIGGRRRWWPTANERWRRRLEAAGHFVLFVDVRDAVGPHHSEESCA